MKLIPNNLPKFKKFCFCASLKTGALTIGYLELFTNTLGIINNLRNDYYDFDDLFTSYITAVFLIIINICLIWGVHQKKQKLILPWLFSKVIAYFCLSIAYVLKIYESLELMAETGMHKFQFLILLINAVMTILFVLGWYTVSVVYSYYSLEFVKVETTPTEEKKKNE